MSLNDLIPAEDHERRASVIASASDTRRSRAFLEAFMQSQVRDAWMLGATPGAGVLLARAGEAAEFGADDAERARAWFRDASEHGDADARAFAGLRRIARAAGHRDHVAAAWEDEMQAAPEVGRRLLAGVGLARVLLAGGAPLRETLELLAELAELVPRCPAEITALYRATLEDALVASGRGDEALRVRVQRWNELALLGTEAREAAASTAALRTAVAAERYGAGRVRPDDWYMAAFELEPTPHALRPLVRSALDRGDAASAEALTSAFVAEHADPTVRGVWQYALARLRAHRLDDRAGALQVLGEAMKGGTTSPAAAGAFLAMARSSHGNVLVDDFVDALGASLDFAASGIERADLLTQMATRFDHELGMSDAAIELAREALAEAPMYRPAMRVLGAIYHRRGLWNALAELTEDELALETHESERLRLHDRLAEVYLLELHEPTAAERHLRAAIALKAHLPAVRRLARLLAEQFRWQDLYDHLMASVDALATERERLYLLEQAGDVAEARLRDVGAAIAAWQRLLDLAPAHPGAIASLGRLFSQTEAWADLLALNEHELSLHGRDIAARVAILTRSAEVARRQLGDLTLAERYYARALDEDSACDEALRGLGSILAAQARWDEVAEMTRREMAAARTEPHRLRCVRQLGELYATRLDDAERAVECFAELAGADGDAREEALVWLERLHQARGDHEALLEVLHQRFAACDDTPSRGRLAFRIAEVLEWECERPRDAFEHAIEALVDPLVARLAIPALDRMWRAEGVDDELRQEAIRCVRRVADGGDDELTATALRFVAERGLGVLAPDDVTAARQRLAEQVPTDVVASEFAALEALGSRDAARAWRIRRNAPVGPVDDALAWWSALELGDDRAPLVPVDPRIMPWTAATLSRDAGDVEAPFDGRDERLLYQRMGHGEISLGALRDGDDSEVGLRFAVMAARAMGDEDGVREGWIALAESLPTPLRAMRAWLDLSAEECTRREERRDWLRSAAELGGYGADLRDELYTAMTANGDHEGLATAIEDHLAQQPPQPETAARLALRRGRALELLGDRDGAIEALRFSAIHAPGDAAVALEKARLETLADRVDEARATLEDCLNAGAQGDDRVELLGRLADLHQMNGGDRQRALAALEEAWDLSGHAREWGIRLASAHAGFGQAPRCAGLLEELLDTPPAAEDIRYWQLLARVLSTKLDRRDDAEGVLWELFEAFPERPGTLAGLEEFYRRHGGAARFAERLGEALLRGATGLSDERAAELWIYVGELHFSVLKQFREAELAFANARRVGADGPDIALREARAAGKQPGRVRDAARLVIDALGDARGDAALWGDAALELEHLFEELDDNARLRVARQLRRTLGDTVDVHEDHVRRDPTRDLEPDLAWSLVGRGLADAETRDVLVAHVPLAEKVFAKQAPSKRDVRGRRLRADEFGAFDAWLGNACGWLGVPVPRVIVSDEAGPTRLVDGGTFVVPAARIGNDTPLQARFHAGRIAGLAFTGLSPLGWVDDYTVRELVYAVAIRALHLDLPEGSSLCDDVAGLLLTPQRRTAAAALRENIELLQDFPDGVSAVAERFADRTGLLLCGDLHVAVGELLHGGGWDPDVADARTRERVVGDGRISDLVRFSLDDAFYLARYESGLGQRPWLFD